MSAPKTLGSQLSRSEGNRRGNTGGEHPLRARCSPSQASDGARITFDASALRYLSASANFNQRCELLHVCDGRRFVPPVKSDDIGEAVNRSTVA
jgi:hypothetical protein